jgi:SAM-dependent methyltransferase
MRHWWIGAIAALAVACQAQDGAGPDRTSAGHTAAEPGATQAGSAERAPGSSAPLESAAGADSAEGQASADREPDVHFVPTPDAVIDTMLRLAEVGPDDVVYDLGCGDGRIVVAAARDFGVRAVGIDIDPERVREARARAEREGVADRVEIRQGDLFVADVSEATVVTLYLLQELNEKLRPKLQRELRPGARIVSQTFDMGSWEPDKRTIVDGTRVYLWTVDGTRSASRGGDAVPSK